ncbi:c-type cytochrome [Luteimonas sp. 8-5]|uniref:c-type cytochrome n=1 Tax=Luteimonas sp. 8-5 TaxID=3039387 RepID=UPI0024374054|nr:c-type cytochrome [Luteimonas sp. 8-5]MDG6348519.1 c-type cytochrome [Luteimonas sp. 8-5]
MSRFAWVGLLLLLVVPAAPVQAQDYVDLRRVTPISGDPVRGESRSELCAACHGPAGISVVPIYPDIAGQRADYMYWQLVKFKAGETVMAAIVADLTDEDMRDLAVYYAGLPAAGPAADPAAEPTEADPPADPAVLARGEQLYLHGDPTAGIPPCQACHGEDARGHPKATEVDAAGYTPYAVYPSLRGQREAYLVSRIGEYQQGKHATLTSGLVMSGAAQHLDQASVQALATWLSSLPR